MLLGSECVYAPPCPSPCLLTKAYLRSRKQVSVAYCLRLLYTAGKWPLAVHQMSLNSVYLMPAVCICCMILKCIFRTAEPKLSGYCQPASMHLCPVQLLAFRHMWWARGSGPPAIHCAVVLQICCSSWHAVLCHAPHRAQSGRLACKTGCQT